MFNLQALNFMTLNFERILNTLHVYFLFLLSTTGLCKSFLTPALLIYQQKKIHAVIWACWLLGFFFFNGYLLFMTSGLYLILIFFFNFYNFLITGKEVNVTTWKSIEKAFFKFTASKCKLNCKMYFKLQKKNVHVRHACIHSRGLKEPWPNNRWKSDSSNPERPYSADYHFHTFYLRGGGR